MDSISIPIHIIQQLNEESTQNQKICDSTRSSSPINLDADKEGCLPPPFSTFNQTLDDCFILYHKQPLSLTTTAPATTTEPSTPSYSDHDRNLFVILENVIPYIPSPCKNSTSKNKFGSENNVENEVDIKRDQKEKPHKEEMNENEDNHNNDIDDSCNIIKLHPALEEFMIYSADAIEENKDNTPNNNNDNIIIIDPVKDENNNTNSHSTIIDKTSLAPTMSSISIPVWIKYTHPPEFYTDDSFFLDLANDDYGTTKIFAHEEYNQCSTLLDCKISTKMFHLQRQTMIYDLTKTVMAKNYDETNSDESDDGKDDVGTGGMDTNIQYKIQMQLEYIHCTDEGYDQYFIEMGKKNPQEEKKQQEQLIMYQYLHQVLCQALEYRIVKKSMILPFVLPPFPQKNDDDYDHDSDNHEHYFTNNDEDTIIAFFKLQTLDVKMKKKSDNNGIICEEDGFKDDLNAINTTTTTTDNCGRENACYRIGAIAQQYMDTSDNMGDEMNLVNNYVSLQITLPSSLEEKNNDNVFVDDNGENKLNESQSNDNPEQLQSINMNERNIDNGDCSCPGYETLVNDIVSLANISIESASPTGILLTGCAGVGKSTLALEVARVLQNISSVSINIISAKDLLLKASSSIIDITSLKKMIRRTKTSSVPTKQIEQRQILVLDDLDVLLDVNSDENGDASTLLFDERRAALHAVLESIDEITQERKMYSINLNGRASLGAKDTHLNYLPLILGIYCSDSMEIPSILNRIGRFEKIMMMPPPSEMQRQEILSSMIHQLPLITNHQNEERIHNCAGDTEKIIRTWSTALARTTAGCVPSDLKRICIDAFTMSKVRHSKGAFDEDRGLLYHKEGSGGVSWENLREATRSCIPSQLAHLDVSIPRDEIEHFDTTDFLDKRGTKEWFQECWQSFGGYRKMKTDLYRTVFRPWCRRHHVGSDKNPISKLEREVPPPTGILFHGESGTGKTFAADCLARSLGLNVIKVKASDVLDKWLGGSEAKIRVIFSRSRAAAPCLLLFDELDALATNRQEDDEGSSDLYSRLLSTLLNEMDGVNNIGGENNVLIVGTTNRIHAIDAALLRPGRFEKHVMIQKPTVEDISDMLKIFFSKAPLSNDIDLIEISKLLHEFRANGADIRGVCVESCLRAIRNIGEGIIHGDVSVEMEDIKKAIDLWKK